MNVQHLPHVERECRIIQIDLWVWVCIHVHTLYMYTVCTTGMWGLKGIHIVRRMCVYMHTYMYIICTCIWYVLLLLECVDHIDRPMSVHMHTYMNISCTCIEYILLECVSIILKACLYAYAHIHVHNLYMYMVYITGVYRSYRLAYVQAYAHVNVYHLYMHMVYITGVCVDHIDRRMCRHMHT